MPALAELGGEEAYLVCLVRLSRAVGDVVGTGEDGVLRADVHNVSTQTLIDHRSGGRLGHEEAPLGHDVVLDVPVRFGRLQQRLGDREAGAVHQQIDAPEGENRGVHGGADVGLSGDVRCDAQGDVVAADVGGDATGPLKIEVGHDDARAPRRQGCGDGLADAAGGAGDQGHPAVVRTRGRQAPELRLLELPVLDAEFLALVDRRVRRDRLRPPHYIDGVYVELGGDACSLLVLPEGKQTHARNEDDRRIGAAHGGRGLVGVTSVVRLVAGAVFLVQCLQPLGVRIEARRGGHVDDQRSDLGAQEMVRARGSQAGQPGQLLAGQELQDDLVFAEVADHRPVRGRHGPQVW